VIEAELLNQLFAGSDAAIALDQGRSLDLLKKPLAEHALNLEMDHHLGDDEQAAKSAMAMPPIVVPPAVSRSTFPRERQAIRS